MNPIHFYVAFLFYQTPALYDHLILRFYFLDLIVVFHQVRLLISNFLCDLLWLYIEVRIFRWRLKPSLQLTLFHLCYCCGLANHLSDRCILLVSVVPCLLFLRAQLLLSFLSFQGESILNPVSGTLLLLLNQQFCAGNCQKSPIHSSEGLWRVLSYA